MKVDVILGLQWGDEGKGKIVDYLTPQYDIIARFQGGPNAGHTLQIAGDKHVLHTIPSGIFHEDKVNIIGNGVIIDPKILWVEIEKLLAKGVDPQKNLYISKRAHLILPTHRLLDLAYETALGKAKIGSTLKGIGPCYTDKTARFGLRVGDILSENFIEKYNSLKEKHHKIIRSYGVEPETCQLDGLSVAEYEGLWFKALDKLKAYHLVDSELFLNKALREGKKILAEGAQGSLLDVDFGSYPFVTSSNTTVAGVCSGLGVPPSAIGRVFGVFKAYCTRVGSGPFPTELFDETGEKIRKEGNEFGSTTGRPRRTGWLDIPALVHTIRLNGVTDLAMMKADVLNPLEKIEVCTAYRIGNDLVNDLTFEVLSTDVSPEYDEMQGWNEPVSNVTAFEKLPAAMQNYIRFIEKKAELRVNIISLGPGRENTIMR